MVTKISKRFRIQDFFRTIPKIESLVVCAIPDIPSKFQKDPSITLSYLADTQTNKQTKTGKNITSLAEVKMQLRKFTGVVIVIVKDSLWCCRHGTAAFRPVHLT